MIFTTKATGRLMFTLALVLIFCLNLTAELYQPKSKTMLEKPSQAEFQNWIEHRSEQHACMKKAERQVQGLKLSYLQNYTEPTPNMYDYDVNHYFINLEFDFTNNYIEGYNEITITSLVDDLNTVDLNFWEGNSVFSVTMDDTIGVSHDQTFWFLMTIYLDHPLDSGQQTTLKVNYGAYPNQVGYMAFYESLGSEILFSSTEPFGSRFWFPCKDFPFDKPDSMDIIATHPADYLFASNGIQQSRVDNGDSTATTHWHHGFPIAEYLITVGCTDYEHYSQTWEYEPGQFMPIESYYLPGAPPSNPMSSAYFGENYVIPVLEALSYWFTLYPWVTERYGHNHFGWGGAMEHQTMTSISPSFNSEWVIAHEAGHQWGGDLVTCRNFHHMWLNEGFASYSEALYIKYHYGEAAYKSWLAGQRQLDAGTPYVEDLVNDNVFDGATVYDKGSWVFYMLHMLLGDDETFRQCMEAYFHDPELKYKSAYTEDLERVAETFYGAPLDWFFNQWVYSPGNPDYEYSWLSEELPDKSGYRVDLFIEQVQSWKVFTMPIEVVMVSGSDSILFNLFNDRRGQLYTFEMPAEPDTILVDPNNKILCTVEYKPEFTVQIVGENLPDGRVGLPYHVEVDAVGGQKPYDWKLAWGQLPYGLIFASQDNHAVISGKPTYATDFTFELGVTDSLGNSSEYRFTINVLEALAICGDFNDDQNMDVADVVYLINYIFVDGPKPSPFETVDVNCDDKIGIQDIIYIINFLFRSGPEPCADCPLE
jgi:aminopeptidase N